MHPPSHPPHALHPPQLPPSDWTADFRERRFERGQSVARPGGRRDEIFVVRSGRLRVHLSGERRELTLLFLEPGDVFSTHTPAWVTAAEPTVLACLPTPQFAQRLAQASPAVVAIMRVLGRLLARTIELVENLVFREAHERLARLLALAVRQQGHPVAGSAGTASAAAPSAPGSGAADAAQQQWVAALPFTLTDMALMIGASRQTASAAFADLERRGVIRRQGRRTLQVLDLAQLEVQGQLQMAAPVSAGRQTHP